MHLGSIGVYGGIAPFFLVDMDSFFHSTISTLDLHATISQGIMLALKEDMEMDVRAKEAGRGVHKVSQSFVAGHQSWDRDWIGLHP